MRVLAGVLLLGCGGTGEVEGDALLQTTLVGEFNNKPWTPMYGFGREETNNFAFYVGAEKISCADDFNGAPRNGNYAATGVQKPAAVGTFSGLFNLIEVVGGDLTGKGATGTIMITAISDVEVSAAFGFSSTIENGRYALTGAVTMLRCD